MDKSKGNLWPNESYGLQDHKKIVILRTRLAPNIFGKHLGNIQLAITWQIHQMTIWSI